MSKKYTFELTIEEGGSESWAALKNITGCEIVTEFVKFALSSDKSLSNNTIKLIKYEDNEDRKDG